MTTAIVLSGRPGGTTHRAVEVLAELPPEFRLIGGLAVMCRVGMPHRATVDLDAITRDLAHHHELLANLAVTSAGGGQYRMRNELDLDVIDIAPERADELAAQLEGDGAGDVTDLELNVVAHAWAHDAATPIDISVVYGDGVPLVEASGRLVASVAGLVAMKVTTVPLRASQRAEKRASDLYDLARLLVTGDRAGTALAGAIERMPVLLGGVIRDRLDAWFVQGAGRDRTYRDLRRFDDPPVDLDEVADAVLTL